MAVFVGSFTSFTCVARQCRGSILFRLFARLSVSFIPYSLGFCFIPFTAVGAHRGLIDFTLSNVRRFYSLMGNPLAAKGLRTSKTS